MKTLKNKGYKCYAGGGFVGGLAEGFDAGYDMADKREKRKKRKKFGEFMDDVMGVDQVDTLDDDETK